MSYLSILCLLLSSSVGGNDRTLDAFDYPSAEAAGRSWQVVAERGDKPLLQVIRQEGRSVLEMPTPFASQPDITRVYMDRDVSLNLAAAGELSLEVFNTAPESGARLSLYFRSGKGWYSAGSELAGSGWQTLRFSKAVFTIEGEPVGWHKIDGIRIAVWRGQSRDAALRARRLVAGQHAVALVIPSGGRSGDSRTARQTTQDVAEMLSELGLGSDAIEDAALVHGALGKRQVAILAYNPDLSTECVEAIVEFVEHGGKLLICYQLPGPLGKVLGFAAPKYYRPEKSQTLAEVRFERDGIDGLPASMRQSSWNITTAEPAEFNARVVGTWFTKDGKATGLPALLLSDRGAFFSHIVLPEDRENKKQMLAAVIGYLAPPLWKQMAETALDRAGRVGHLEEYATLDAFLRASSDAQVRSLVESARKIRDAALRKQSQGQFAEAVRLAGQLRSQLTHAYLTAQPSKAVEGRAIWNHSGTGAYEGDWDRTARELAEAGFNMVMPNMLWGGRAHYPSNVLPRSRTYQQYGDQIAQCVAACKKYGLQVHVWKVNWNLSGAPRSFVEQIHREHRNQVSEDGTAHDWLCPSHPKNFQLELDSMLEVARLYDVDGLHFDYIRYPDRSKCYCDGCRDRFEKERGQKVEHWPQDCYAGSLQKEYAAWRCDQITRLVKAVHQEAKKVRPNIEISAAVFGAYPSCKESVAQDWLKWVQQGYLDFVCPMDYTQNDQAFVNLVTNQLKMVDARIPVYPGIGQWRLTDDRTVGQIHYARQLGAPGFTVFNLDGNSIRTAVPAIGAGAGQCKASPGR